LRRALAAALVQAPTALMRVRLREVLEVDYSERAPGVTVPVLYLQAAQDRIVFASSARHLQSLWPALQVVTLRGPHLLLQARPQESASSVSAYFHSNSIVVISSI
jgi:pimeloyl-[acyl-carrier protein] methyl ester esterase